MGLDASGPSWLGRMGGPGFPSLGEGKLRYLGPLGTRSVEAELLIGGSRVEKAM